MSNTVRVKPIKSFDWNGEMKHPESKPFDVTTDQAAELRANGLVESDKKDDKDEKKAKEPDNKMAKEPSNKGKS